jgi:type IV pilus assembly protein PilB
MITNPLNSIFIEDFIKESIGKGVNIKFYLITESDFNQILISKNSSNEIEYDMDSLDDLEVLSLGSQIYDVSGEDISTIVNLVNKILFTAATLKASDIHIEPYEIHTRVRLRIDGILHKVLEIPPHIHTQIVNRIKTMGNMDINNSRKPQSGSTRLKVLGHTIDVRISTMPSQISENVVLRLLDKNAVTFELSALNFSNENYKKFMELVLQKEGIVLITGPTGSGKSTTLYCAIVMLNDETRAIATLENPVEYNIYGIVQTQVNEEIGLTFETGLREILRQDPEVILVGEIRDDRTADTAVKASNTGHLVLSTLHTNNAVSSVIRLIETGVEPFMVASTLNGVVSQRLLRKVCTKCKTQYYLEKESIYRKVLNSNNDIILYKGIGCKECNNTGYKGRIAVHELLVLDDELRNIITEKSTIKELQEIAIKNGMKTIYDDALEKALQGLTTLDEIHRVLHFKNL